MLAPLATQAADLVVWWDKGYQPEEDAAIRETVAAFEQKTGKQVELSLHEQSELPDELQAALKAGRPPDFAFGIWLNQYAPGWASEGRLIELTATVASLPSAFDADSLSRWTMLDAQTGQRALYGLPIGRTGNYLHVWKSLLARAGLTLDDIPKEWEPFWTFWCDKVQPALRQALGREDVWGVGRVMSVEAADTEDQFFQFVQAADANYVSRDGKLLTSDPEVRHRLIQALSSYTEVWRKGCTPPDALHWNDAGNNKAFLERRVVITSNVTLTIPNALKAERPGDYYENTATIEWPLGRGGNRFPIYGDVVGAMVFDAGHVPTAKDFARFLVEEGWLAQYLNFAGDRILPAMPAMLDQPFWLDTRDPHKMAAVGHAQSRPLALDYSMINPRFGRVYTDRVWAKAIHSVAAESVMPEQAVDEAIARIKQILSE
jgi:multiple sugar transport system substrate-binding protein